MIPEDEASGRLKELYDKYTEPWGGVDNVLKIHSLNPRSMEAHFNLYIALMRGALRSEPRAAGDDCHRRFGREPVSLLNQASRGGTP